METLVEKKVHFLYMLKPIPLSSSKVVNVNVPKVEALVGLSAELTMRQTDSSLGLKTPGQKHICT